MPDNDLRFSDVTLRKSGSAILRGVSGCLRRGSVTAILGPNGAGKSSLLHCLAGVEMSHSAKRRCSPKKATKSL